MEYTEPQKFKSITYYPYSVKKEDWQPAYVYYLTNDNKTPRSKIIKYKDNLMDKNVSRCYRGRDIEGKANEMPLICKRYNALANTVSNDLGFRPVLIIIDKSNSNADKN